MKEYGKYDLLRIAGLRPKPISEEQKRYGSFNKRNMAAAIDLLLLSMTVVPIVDILFFNIYGAMPETTLHVEGKSSSDIFKSAIHEMLSSEYFKNRMSWHIYSAMAVVMVCWYFWSATPGKVIMHLRIVDVKTGAPMSHSQQIIRLFSYFISALPLGLGFIWVALNKKKRGWHDYLAGTAVENVPWRGFKAMFRRARVADHLSNSPEPSPKE